MCHPSGLAEHPKEPVSFQASWPHGQVPEAGVGRLGGESPGPSPSPGCAWSSWQRSSNSLPFPCVSENRHANKGAGPRDPFLSGQSWLPGVFSG